MTTPIETNGNGEGGYGTVALSPDVWKRVSYLLWLGTSVTDVLGEVGLPRSQRRTVQRMRTKIDEGLLQPLGESTPQVGTTDQERRRQLVWEYFNLPFEDPRRETIFTDVQKVPASRFTSYLLASFENDGITDSHRRAVIHSWIGTDPKTQQPDSYRIQSFEWSVVGFSLEEDGELVPIPPSSTKSAKEKKMQNDRRSHLLASAFNDIGINTFLNDIQTRSLQSEKGEEHDAMSHAYDLALTALGYRARTDYLRAHSVSQ